LFAPDADEWGEFWRRRRREPPLPPEGDAKIRETGRAIMVAGMKNYNRLIWNVILGEIAKKN
jgi:hypothetical protein